MNDTGEPRDLLNLGLEEQQHEMRKATGHIKMLMARGYTRAMGPVDMDGIGMVTATLWAKEDGGIVTEIRADMNNGSEQITFCYPGKMKHGPGTQPEAMTYEVPQGMIP